MEVSLRQGAAISFFILIALQFPFFSLRDEDGKNTIAVSPLEVVVSELRMTKAVPPEVLHALLYPGAAKDSLSAYFFCMKGPGQCSEGGMLPDMEALLELKIIPLDKQLSKQLGKQKMLMIAASFFNLGGGLSAPFYATRLVMFGTLLTFWGCFQAQCAFFLTEFGVRDSSRAARRRAGKKAAAAAAGEREGEGAGAGAGEGEDSKKDK